MVLKHKSGQQNKATEPLDHRVLVTLKAELTGFEQLQDLYADDLDFANS